MDISGLGTGNGTNIYLWEKTGAWNQKWTLDKDGYIINPQTGKVADIAGLGTAQGTNIYLWEKTGAWNQKWAFEEWPNLPPKVR